MATVSTDCWTRSRGDLSENLGLYIYNMCLYIYNMCLYIYNMCLGRPLD